jgi:hypothetical protein
VTRFAVCLRNLFRFLRPVGPVLLSRVVRCTGALVSALNVTILLKMSGDFTLRAGARDGMCVGDSMLGSTLRAGALCVVVSTAATTLKAGAVVGNA